MNNEAEEEELYANVVEEQPKLRKDPYDEVTVNFGRPVIQSPCEDDLFASVTFTSPIEDSMQQPPPMAMVPPVPAPRLSKQRNQTRPSTCDILEEVSNSDLPKEPPQVPPRNVILLPEVVVYQEILEEEEEEDDEEGGAPQPRLPQKADTINIRNTISKWYDEASEEIQRDLSLDLSILEVPPTIIKEENEEELQQQNASSPPPLSDQGATAIDTNPPTTLLRDFDPIILEELKDELKEEGDEKMREKSAPENFYVAVPFNSRESISSTESIEPPTSPPPPLPQSEPPETPTKHVSYENIWLDPLIKRPQIMQSPPPVPPRLKPKQPSFLARSNDDSAISSSASSSSNDVHVLANNSSSSSTPTPQRSFSALNLATKFASNIKRKMSDQNFVLQGKVVVAPHQAKPGRAKSVPFSPSSYPSHLKTRSGVLYVYSRSRRTFQPKWCMLNHADFKYFNDKQTVAIPKETVPIASILSLQKHESVAYAPQQVEVFTFNVCYMTNKYQTLTLGAATLAERDKWMDKIIYNLDYNLEGLGTASKLTWVQLKTGFAGTWNKSWISIDASSEGRWFKYTEELYDKIGVDLKKIKNLTLVKDVKNLAVPMGHNLPVLVMDCPDRSLYLQSSSEKEALALQDLITRVAFSNTNDLNDQQLTSEDIPVIVDKCIGFVYGHGCMTEGIYRHSGVNTKINRLLELFQGNIWSVHLTRDSFSEHDVANALKRFFRTLREPILTEKLRPMFLQAASVEEANKKMERYRNLVQLLPKINYNTLKKLMSHLVAIASHSGKNLMPNYNLGAIWGPSLLTVDSMQASTYAQTSSESDVCRDLIDNYKFVFNVPDEELKKEAKISETLEKINKYDRGRCLLKRSGDLRLWVYIDTKSSGNCVCVVAKPSMTALEMTKKVLQEKCISNSQDLVLHEAVLGGALQRPIHHSELVLDVALKWGSWGEEDRRDNYLLLKRNILYEEALAYSNRPFSVFGEAHFAEIKNKSFKKHMLSMSNARLTINKSEDVELASWPIEDISWYLGCEPKRHPPHSLNVTFIHPRHEPVVRSKEKPHFGRTVSFESRDFYIKWIAAMLVAEYANDLKPISEDEKLVLLEDDDE